jgi:N-formylmaleamate deformylase
MSQGWEHGEIAFGDLTVHYTRTGGNKPVLVLAHGVTDNGMCWLPVAQELSSEFDVILPDARAHGRSSRAKPGQEFDLPADLEGFIQAMGLQRPLVGGHSMGAATAAQLGARFPEAVRAMFLEDPPWMASDVSLADPGLDWLLSLKDLPQEEIVAACRQKCPNWPEVELQPWAESKQQVDPKALAMATKSAGARSLHADWRTTVRAIRVPTLVLIADTTRGALMTREVAEEVCALNPLMRSVYIPEAGHSIRRENYTDYMKAVRSFLEGIH